MIVDVECPRCNGNGEVCGVNPNRRSRFVGCDDLSPDDFTVKCPKCLGASRGREAAYLNIASALFAEAAREYRAALRRVEALEAGLRSVIHEGELLLQNAEGCALNHYGHDVELFGMPGWITTCRERLTEARALMETNDAH